MMMVMMMAVLKLIRHSRRLTMLLHLMGVRIQFMVWKLDIMLVVVVRIHDHVVVALNSR